MSDNVYEQQWAKLETPVPTESDYTEFTQLPGGEWLPKTDWSRDRIIANDD